MVAVIQRVSTASVYIEGSIHSAIDCGLLILLGISHNDNETDADWLCSKICQMRLFADTENKMNLNLSDISGDLLIISQFTLLASTKKGNRPSFIEAAKPEIAIPLYNYFIRVCEQMLNKPVFTGQFGADMKVTLVNNGPITIIIDSKNKQ